MERQKSKLSTVKIIVSINQIHLYDLLAYWLIPIPAQTRKVAGPPLPLPLQES